MQKTLKRNFVGRGKGYLNAAGPQSRFIIFLIFVLIGYTFLLRVFLKLAEILQLPLFLPISLIALLLFVGIAGTVYSHGFVGPLARIRGSVDRLAQGENISLKLRESDDPILKDLARSITDFSEHIRNARSVLQSSGRDLLMEISQLENIIEKGADKAEVLKQLGMVRAKQELLERAVQSLGKL